MPTTRGQRKKEEEAKEKSLFGKYQSLMAAYPFGMNQLQSSMITAGAVYTSNQLSGDDNNMEVLIMVIVTLTFITPILLKYYGWLNKQNLALVPSLVVDQFLFSPIFTFGILLWRGIVTESIDLVTWRGVIAEIIAENDHLGDWFLAKKGTITTVLSILPGIMKKSWMYWIPIRLLILKFVPPMYHVVLGSVCSFIWQIIMALALK